MLRAAFDLLLHILFGESYVRRFRETRPRSGETDHQYAKRLRRLHRDTGFFG
jgi:hypothetical protein